MPSTMRRFVHPLVVVVAFSCMLKQATGAANLDLSEPIVKRSPASGGDKFGYSVVLHSISQPVDSNFESFLNSTRLIVGAPYGTYPGGIPDLPASSTAEPEAGLVYQCPVTGYCEGILGRSAETDRRLFDGDANTATENKTGQLMGSVLYSSGQFFVACAPLYVVFSGLNTDLDDSRPVGRCFVSSSNLENFSEIRPCDGLTRENPQLTLGSNSQCLSGFSAAVINHKSPEGTVVVAALGDNTFAGNLFYYTANGSAVTSNGGTGNTDNDRAITYQYEGYSIAIGDVTGINSSDIISGVPRDDGATLFGSVRVRTQVDLTGDSVVANLTGTQLGEYFGAVVVAADLNNDGYDEVIVGAPIFSSANDLEIGRVYIFENAGGSLETTPIVLEGTSVQSRFGSSIVGLGDINGDGFHDIAVGAPYEGSGTGANSSGTVYIYYGRSSASGLISPNPNQVLFAQNIVDNVPGTTSLHGFGFSLSSGVDVDGNFYNDLLVGAHTSSTAVLIRSLSVAYITISVSTNMDTFQLDTGSNLVLTVCGSYFGRGLDGRPLKTLLKVREISSGNRVYFQTDAQGRNNLTTDFIFATTQEPSCMNLTVFGKSARQLAQQSIFLSRIQLLTPIQLLTTFVELPRPSPTYVDGSPVVLVDYRDIPILVVKGNNTVSVVPTINCPIDSSLEVMCTPDLTVTLRDTAYLNSQEERIPGSVAIAGLLQTIRIDLTYDNIGPNPALGSEVLFMLPMGFTFTSSKVPKGSQEVTCQEDSAISRLFHCPLTNYIPPESEAEGSNNLSLTWRLSRSLVGNEPMQTSDISIQLTSASDAETNTSNNDLIGGPVEISYAAFADLDISNFNFTITVPTYRRTAQVVNPNILQIGRTVELSFRAVNRGPSNSPNTVVDIYVPTNDTADSFYLYLTNVTAHRNGVQLPCDFSGVNPQGLSDPNILSVTKRRKKRSVVDSRHTRQASAETQTDLQDVIKNCSDPSERASGRCTRISCNVQNFVTSQVVEIVISAALDDRFFQSQVDPFLFVAYSSIRNNDSFLEDLDQSNNQNAASPYRVTLFIETEDSSLPIWIPIVCGIVAVIIIICLFIFLYCVGFFRRKKRGAEEVDGGNGVDVYHVDQPPMDDEAADELEKDPDLMPEPVYTKPMDPDVMPESIYTKPMDPDRMPESVYTKPMDPDVMPESIYTKPMDPDLMPESIYTKPMDGEDFPTVDATAFPAVEFEKPKKDPVETSF